MEKIKPILREINKMNVTVISLERAPERRNKIIKQLNSLKVDYFILDAVDGNNLSEEELNKSIKIGRWRVNELFKPGEIGCTMSHINVIKHAKMQNWPNLIVLEDDVILAEDFSKRINILFKFLPRNWEHVYLSGTPDVEPMLASLMFPNIIPSGFTRQTHSMMINSSAYDKIIDKLSKFETTTDDIYGDLINNKKLISYTYYPFVSYAEDEYTYIWNHNINRTHPSKKYFKNKL